MKRRASKPKSRADRLMPYAERYISLVIERKWRASRMHQRDAKKLDHDIDEALVDYERADAREAIAAAEEAEARAQAPVARKTRTLLRPVRRANDPAHDHPWNQRAVMPKKR